MIAMLSPLYFAVSSSLQPGSKWCWVSVSKSRPGPQERVCPHRSWSNDSAENERIVFGASELPSHWSDDCCKAVSSFELICLLPYGFVVYGLVCGRNPLLIERFFQEGIFCGYPRRDHSGRSLLEQNHPFSSQTEPSSLINMNRLLLGGSWRFRFVPLLSSHASLHTTFVLRSPGFLPVSS